MLPAPTLRSPSMRPILFPAAVAVACCAHAQAPSDSLFTTDQVLEVHLEFSDPDFWNTLTTYYTNDLGQTLTAAITITDQYGTFTFDSVEVDLKGNSSYSHPGNKKSFKVDFNDHLDEQKFRGLSKMHFNNCWSDPTFLREKVFFDFCVDHGVLAPRVEFANVYMNGTFWGFYNTVEAVDKNFLDRWVDDNDGNLFKAGDNFAGGGGGGGTSGEADLKYYGSSPSSYTSRYELKTNETANDWTDLIALLDLLNNTSDADLATQLPDQWVWAPLLRSLALDNLFANLDAYINSARNYYLYHDSTTFQWNWIHWDANMAFGRYSGMGGGGGGSLLNLAPNYLAANRPLMTKVMGIPSFYNDYLTEYCAVFDDFTNAALDPHIDSLVDLIAPHVYADANKQYTSAQFDANIDNNITVTGGGGGGGGGTQTVYGLKSFITSRRSYLSGALPCTTLGVPDARGSEVLGLWPNPANENVTIRTGDDRSVISVRVYDATGRKLLDAPWTPELSVSGYAPGSYVVEVVFATGGTARAQVVMQH